MEKTIYIANAIFDSCARGEPVIEKTNARRDLDASNSVRGLGLE